jgi:hypothetical protein
MEDERNWSDASYKTYTPPLSVPFPSQVNAGRHFSQAVTLSIHGDRSGVEVETEPEPTVIRLGEKTFSIPRIGVGLPSGTNPLTARCQDRLRALRLSHLRIDLKLSDDGFEIQLERAAAEASNVGATLEVAIFLTDNAHAEIERLQSALNRIRPQVFAWLVFHVAETSTTQKWLDMARSRLSHCTPGALFGGGTDAYFAQLNRCRPPSSGIDVVCYPLSPQVHVFDHDSLIENLRAQAATVESARQFAGRVPLAVTPITLRPRSNPDATCIEGPVERGELPRHVDPRQMALLGAVWTVGTLHNLAEAGVYSTTFYESVGWAGLMDTENGSSLPAKFPSVPDSVFPLYHFFADVGEFRGGEAVLCSSSDPLKAHAIALRKNGSLRIVLANVTAEVQTVRFLPGSSDRVFRAKLLNERSAEFAMSAPEAFRAAEGESIAIEEKGRDIQLAPWAIMRLDH